MILVLTAGFGDGHNTAARNVAQALGRLGSGETVQVVDVFDVAHPFVGPLLKQGYQALITRWPALWSWTYRHSGGLKFNEGYGDVLLLLRLALGKLLEKHQPRAVVSTYPLYARMLQQIAAGGGYACPLFTVVTDSISIHRTWALGGSHGYFVADEASKASLAGLGIATEKITVSGFPVSLDFMEPPAPEERNARQTILYLPSTAVSYVRRTLDALQPVLATGAKITLPVGKHMPRLYHVLRRFVDTLPEDQVEIIGWTSRMPHLLQTHDLVICKAGGAILHEAAAARCPAIIDYIVPGQEEGNAELLTSHACGVVSHSPEETGQLASRLLANNAAEAKKMSESARAISEPAAAMKVAETVLERLRAAVPMELPEEWRVKDRVS